MKTFFSALLFLITQQALAFIPKANTILQKWVENNGTGIYTIEQDVTFPSSPDPIILRETWVVENENTMKLTVTGLGGKLKWVFVYKNGSKYQNVDGTKKTNQITDDFIEKYFHYRKPETLSETLVRVKAGHTALFQPPPFKGGKEPDFQSDPWLRLSRVGGVIAFAFGLVTELPAENHAYFFIEQDQFILRKFRMPTVEVTADNYNTFSRSLMFPRLRTIKWNNQQVTIQTIQVSARGEKKAFSSVEKSTAMDFPELGVAKPVIEDFYKRFR